MYVCVFSTKIKEILSEHVISGAPNLRRLVLCISARKILFTTDGSGVSLNGFCMYFLRTSTKRTLGEETFQVEHLHNLTDCRVETLVPGHLVQPCSILVTIRPALTKGGQTAILVRCPADFRNVSGPADWKK
jgi:hypothetical protein